MCGLRTILLLPSGFPLNGARLVNTPLLNKCFGMEFDCPALKLMMPKIRVLAELAPPHFPDIFSALSGVQKPLIGTLAFGGMPKHVCGEGFPKSETITLVGIKMF